MSVSYAMRLMTWRDLDIYLEMSGCDTGAFLELGRELGVALAPRTLSFTDHLQFPATRRAAVAILGLRTGVPMGSRARER